MKTTLSLKANYLLALIFSGLLGVLSLAANDTYCHNTSLRGYAPILMGLLTLDSFNAEASTAELLPLTPLAISAAQPVTTENMHIAFAAAAPEVQKYQEAWEKIYHSKISPHLLCREHGRCLPDLLKLARLAQQHFHTTDFNDTAAILDQALLTMATSNNQAAKERLENLFLHQQHAALQFQVWSKLNVPITDSEQMRHAIAAARHLHAFRQNFHLELSPWLSQLRAWEWQSGDLAGSDWQQLFADATPLQKLPVLAMLRLDQAGLAKKQQWQNQSLAVWKVNARATPFIINQAWAPQVATADKGRPLWLMLNNPTAGRQENANQQLYLNFRGLPGRCAIYQNGRELGRKHEMLPESFRVPIDQIKENTNTQIIIQLLDGAMTQTENWAIWLSTQKKE